MQPLILALILAGYGALAATVALYLQHRFQRSHSNYRLKNRLDELEAGLDSQAEWWKKLNANVASIRGRLKGPAIEPTEQQTPNGESEFAMLPGESPEQWKARMRRGLATGQIRSPRG